MRARSLPGGVGEAFHLSYTLRQDRFFVSLAWPMVNVEVQWERDLEVTPGSILAVSFDSRPEHMVKSLSLSFLICEMLIITPASSTVTEIAWGRVSYKAVPGTHSSSNPACCWLEDGPSLYILLGKKINNEWSHGTPLVGRCILFSGVKIWGEK